MTTSLFDSSFIVCFDRLQSLRVCLFVFHHLAIILKPCARLHLACTDERIFMTFASKSILNRLLKPLRLHLASWASSEILQTEALHILMVESVLPTASRHKLGHFFVHDLSVMSESQLHIKLFDHTLLWVTWAYRIEFYYVWLFTNLLWVDLPYHPIWNSSFDSSVVSGQELVVRESIDHLPDAIINFLLLFTLASVMWSCLIFIHDCWFINNSWASAEHFELSFLQLSLVIVKVHLLSAFQIDGILSLHFILNRVDCRIDLRIDAKLEIASNHLSALSLKTSERYTV